MESTQADLIKNEIGKQLEIIKMTAISISKEQDEEIARLKAELSKTQKELGQFSQRTTELALKINQLQILARDLRVDWGWWFCTKISIARKIDRILRNDNIDPDCDN